MTSQQKAAYANMSYTELDPNGLPMQQYQPYMTSQHPQQPYMTQQQYHQPQGYMSTGQPVTYGTSAVVTTQPVQVSNENREASANRASN